MLPNMKGACKNCGSPTYMGRCLTQRLHPKKNALTLAAENKRPSVAAELKRLHAEDTADVRKLRGLRSW